MEIWNQMSEWMEGLKFYNQILMLNGIAMQRIGSGTVIDHVMAVDPLTPLTRCMPGFLNAMEGRFESAIGHYRDMLERDPAKRSFS